MKSLLASAILCAFASNATAADLLQFAERYQGKYASEVTDQAAFDQEFVIRTRLGEPFSTGWVYDDNTGFATLTLNSVMNKLGMTALVDVCKSHSRGTGVTGFGVRVSFTRQTCNRVFAKDYGDTVLGDPAGDRYRLDSKFSIPVSPTEFRRLKELGYINVVIGLTPTQPGGVLVEKTVSGSSATATHPYETLMNLYHVHGSVHEAQYFLPWAKTPFATQQIVPH